MAAETDLPRNAPGVYLLFPPKVLLRPGMQDLGIDDYFVPGATNAPPPPPEGQRNPSPYDATLLLAGGRFTIAQLFEPLGPIWNPTRGRLGTEGSMEDAVRWLGGGGGRAECLQRRLWHGAVGRGVASSAIPPPAPTRTRPYRWWQACGKSPNARLPISA